MVPPNPITVSWLFAGGIPESHSVLLRLDKPIVCLDCLSALPCWRTWARPSTKALVDFGSAPVVTYGAFFWFLPECSIKPLYFSINIINAGSCYFSCGVQQLYVLFRTLDCLTKYERLNFSMKIKTTFCHHYN